MKYQQEFRSFVVVDAEQFDPQQKPWPKGVSPWPDAVYGQPRDCSWGYVLTATRRVHVQAGDWIVTFGDGGHDCFSEDYFKLHWKPVP